MTVARHDAVVIGSGIIGAACALDLSNEGLRVLVLDRNTVASGATAAGMGHLVLLDDSEAQFELARYSLQLWRGLAGSLPRGCNYWECGTVWIASNADELRSAAEKQVWYRARGVEAELLTEQQLREAEPNLRKGLAGALLIPRDAAVSPPAAARYLLERAGRQGCRVQTGVRVDRLEDDRLLLDDGTVISAGAVIVATGADAAMLLPDLPVRGRKGHLLVADTCPHFARHQIIELAYITSTQADQGDSVTFNARQRAGSELLIGSSRQFDSMDNRVDPPVLEQILKLATGYMPALAKARLIESWAGFRASTPDGLPLIGKHPSLTNVFVATGHEGLGATMSLGTGRLIAAAVSGRSAPIDPGPYSPVRIASPQAVSSIEPER